MHGGGTVSHAMQNQDQPDIQWFKEEMKIAPNLSLRIKFFIF
jgi:hypothetical protein